jgi:porphobilinogen synthase
MPGVFQLSVDQVVLEARAAFEAGVPSVILFGLPDRKDAIGSSGWDPHGPVARSIAAIKDALPELVVMTDVCMCEYTDHGHCGKLEHKRGKVEVANDATLELLVREALCHARAGADVVAPSDMMDGRVAAIRRALDQEGFGDVAILSYAAKYASGFYGPFREAADSAPKQGDRRGYQMDPANVREALKEVRLDLEEGADMVMVKPGMPYLDIVRRVKDTFKAPTYVYQVSGEYSMLKAAINNGWLEEKKSVLEAMLAFKRAGADGVLSYFSLQVARWLKDTR